MMKLLGMKDAKAKKASADVMRVETEIAKISKTRVQRRDVAGMYNKINRPGVAEKAPSFFWDDYFKGLGLADVRDISVTSVEFFEGVEKLLKEIRPAVWRNYLKWQVLNAKAQTLPKAFDDEAFTMIKAITGQEERRVRWKRCVEATDRALGEALGQPFVSRVFAGKSKEAAESMVHGISDAFASAVDKLDWMSDATKKRANEKRLAMDYLIGYPSKWRTYDFAIDRGAYTKNALEAYAFYLAREMEKIGKPVDRQEWQMTPATVNAYYDPQLNHMVFPAGILQPPFYHAEANLPVNYGAIGMVVAHEMTHGYDDEGSKFAGDGNMIDWWTAEDTKRFEGLTKCVAEQYSGFEQLPGFKINGELTLGENIADIAGVKLAFAAYRAARKDAAERVVADGFTEDQQFFLAVGQSWCSKYREEFAHMALKVDPHSPPKFRVIGSLSNLDDFADAFSCKVGSPMHPKKTCSVW
jgi:putative endopeptidase